MFNEACNWSVAAAASVKAAGNLCLAFVGLIGLNLDPVLVQTNRIGLNCRGLNWKARHLRLSRIE